MVEVMNKLTSMKTYLVEGWGESLELAGWVLTQAIRLQVTGKKEQKRKERILIDAPFGIMFPQMVRQESEDNRMVFFLAGQVVGYRRGSSYGIQKIPVLNARNAPFFDHVSADARDGPAGAECSIARVIIKVRLAKQQPKKDNENGHAHREDDAEQPAGAAVEG
jgi:hypothetical protein